MPKTWEEKFRARKEVEIDILEKPFAGQQPGGKMLISTPAEIDQAIRRIPRGSSLDPVDLRRQLAKVHSCDFTCPLTTGIFLRIIAEVAWNELENGAKLDAVTPFWRVVSPKTPLAKKLRCGTDWIANMRASEGI